MTILSDHPILREDEPSAAREPDSFLLASRLGAVFDIIRHRGTRPPLAIAVYGDWGTGKSSAMRWLSEELIRWSESGEHAGHCRIRTVWFDPWKYQQREDVWRGLIAEVILNAIDIKKASLRTVQNAAKKFGLFLGRSFLNALSSVELSAGAEEVGGKATVNLEGLTKIAEDYRQTAHPEKAYLNEFEHALKDWVNGALAADERMVIFIDDLDRCLPEVVLEVLEALKLYLDIPRLIFVVGLDRDVVEAVIRQHYKKQELDPRKAAQYLAKMFQVELDIPPSQTQMEGYLSRQIEQLDTVTEGYWSTHLNGWKSEYRKVIEGKIRDLAEYNPREIKRLLNSALLRASAAARHDALGGSEHQRFTQGCQVYLIQRVLRRYVQESDGLLRENKALRFLAEWSQFVHRFPGWRSKAALREERGIRRGKPELEGADAPPANPEAEIAFASLRNRQPWYHDRKEQYPLLGLDDLWELMQIPFSESVAAAAEAERPPGAETPSALESPMAASAPVPPPAPAPAMLASSEGQSKDTVAHLPRTILSAIAGELGKPVARITDADLARVENLDLWGVLVTDPTPLAKLTALKGLDVWAMQVNDLSFLANLTLLERLNLGGTADCDLTPLANLTALKVLGLVHTHVSDLAPLASLTTLQRLNLYGTPVTDLTPLANLTALEWLNLAATHVSILTPAAKLTALTDLDLGGTGVTDLTPLANLTSLKRLALHRTKASTTQIDALRCKLPECEIST